MSNKGTISTLKVPYTEVKCPQCNLEYKEKHPRKDYSICPNGHTNKMEVRKRNNIKIITLLDSK